jgi:urea carboxylase
MFNKVLIANRGAIATRIIRTLKRMGIGSVAIHADADMDSLHLYQADEAYPLGEGGAADTYLNAERILEIARRSGASAIHPGYGFLSENANFERRCAQEGIAFIGPTAGQMEAFGLKHRARQLAEAAEVPLLPGSGLLTDLQTARDSAARIGYPVMLKSSAGGGGIGMHRCHDETELDAAFDSVRRLGATHFANDAVFVEKFVARARHIEVQVFGDGKGRALAIGERDCSCQRRNQKVIEECPAPHLPDPLRTRLHATAERLLAQVAYRSAGTVEFLYDTDAGRFYFLEVNTRLQVEHGVTEAVFGIDLVEWMIRLAAGEPAGLEARRPLLAPRGHALQVRLYAEDPARNFQPAPGLLSEVVWPEQPGLRIDHWISPGTEVSPFFDPMLAKLITHADQRADALQAMRKALDGTRLYGTETNRDYLRALLDDPLVIAGRVTTAHLADFPWQPARIEVLQGGTQTSIQAWPGRRGYWHVGLPPSGPFDGYSFRLGNRLLGNDEGLAGLEITLQGPTLQFSAATRVLIAGAAIEARLYDAPGADGSGTEGVGFDYAQPTACVRPLSGVEGSGVEGSGVEGSGPKGVKPRGVGLDCAQWQPIAIAPGQTLSLGRIQGQGARAYLLIAGGFDCPEYLGSGATFTLGQLGGHNGRALRAGDVLRWHHPSCLSTPAKPDAALLPTLGNHWTLRVIYGPQGAPDFFTHGDIERFFSNDWEVHYHSSRTGIRLIGPKPEWARPDGGEAGLHPSNIHDNAYAFGSIDFTGDMPVILGPDGPSLGGFVCPATVIHADLWMLGQLRAGDRVRFVPVSLETAVTLERVRNRELTELRAQPLPWHSTPPVSPVLRTLDAATYGDRILYRAAGDHFLLVEYGPQALQIRLRFRAHALMQWLQQHPFDGMYELTPGIRSLQIHYDSQRIDHGQLLDYLQGAEAQLARQLQDIRVPSRIVHLPLSWDDDACRLAIEKYQQSVRPGAPWCPSNLEFIRRINGLESIDAVKQILFSASYLVMGLGDVYLGAPVATPIDPRHRLVTTKYNPARTWTAENAVGIGGSYLCVYGMEGPGGYQFVGRTLQMWNRWRRTEAFNQPWLLRFFDQIRFFEVSAETLHRIRRDFPRGRYPLRIEQSHFSLAEHEAFLRQKQDGIQHFMQQRDRAFSAELARWHADGQFNYDSTAHHEQQGETLQASWPETHIPVDSPVAGSLWKRCVQIGDRVRAGETLLILESMKMEIDLAAPLAATVSQILVAEGDRVLAGQPLVILEELP